LMGENSHAVAGQLQTRLSEVQRALPDDVKIVTMYDRTELVDWVIATVTHNLLAGALLVIAVLFALLGQLRAGLVVATASHCRCCSRAASCCRRASRPVC